MANVRFTRRDARTGARRVVNRTTAPMRAVLKQVPTYTAPPAPAFYNGQQLREAASIRRSNLPEDLAEAAARLEEEPDLQRRRLRDRRDGEALGELGLPFVEFPYGPVDVKYANIALRYSQIKRPGLQPLLVHTAPQLNVVTFTAVIADKRTGGKNIIEDTLDTLKEMAAADMDCEFIYGLSALPYRVRITQMNINSRYRNLEGQLTQANVSIQLTEAPLFDPLLGELSAVTPVGAPPPPIVSPVSSNEADNPDDPDFTPIIHIIRRRQDVEVD